MLATDSLSLVFIACFLFGLLFLLAVAFLGQLSHGHGGVGHDAGTGHGLIHGVQAHVGDTFHASHASSIHADAHHHVGGGDHGGEHDGGHGFSLLALLNPTAIVLFLLWFGFFGYLFHNVTNLTLPITIVCAVGSGIILAALIVNLFDRLVGHSEATTVQDISERTGLVGKVNMAIPANSLGEIIYISPGGHRKTIPARSADGRRLERGQEIVVLSYQRGIAEVDTWEHFIEQEGGTLNENEVDKLHSLMNDLNVKDSDYAVRQDMQKE
ncbi:hypothetical protein [Ktedonospora formicarum]|uniref:Membrane protein NfeD2 N-terminal transmembrane domain-containing protein n=1 Tax=Ktedonospora formicarum TaxID=2778364 RepID=A0A8J3HXX7_9CHLR|nr:hypothetical protein [Ktedonospora formicarum]GHO45246.1 hypothetical protein KSX_34090 [Ktedonospora formicarum]